MPSTAFGGRRARTHAQPSRPSGGTAGNQAEANRRLLGHPGRERGALFTFPARPGVQATNWRAEQAIRPAVVSRKQRGGNATWEGACCWSIPPS